ncbi:MAG: hypothetical protein LUG86_00710 [Oscillospiraceae bacterium]|nr:hypothetical protein [Oscillospiraceae bacterium]
MKFVLDKSEFWSIIKYRTKVQNKISGYGGRNYVIKNKAAKNKAAPKDDFASKIGKEKRRNKNMNVIKNTQLYYIKLFPICQVLFLGIYEIRRDEYG